MRVAAGRRLYRVYRSEWGHDEFNPGRGDSRFAPFDSHSTGQRVPTMYLAETPQAAMLETILRDLDEHGRIIYESQLRGMLLAHIEVPSDLTLGDLRDPALARMNIGRHQVVSSPAEHYPCTRRLAIEAEARTHHGKHIDGLIWHSRQAEIAGTEPVEAMVVFGSRYDTSRGRWTLASPGIETFTHDLGRLRLDRIVSDLGGVILK